MSFCRNGCGRCWSIALLFLSLYGPTASLPAQNADQVHLANGIKIGEVTPTSAIIWTRLTVRPERLVSGVPFAEPREGEAVEEPEIELHARQGSVPGVAGVVRLTYWIDGEDNSRVATAWQAVDTGRDFTTQFRLEELQPTTRYRLIAEGRSGAGQQATCRVESTFRTAPPPEVAASVRFTVVTGQSYANRDSDDGHQIYPRMQQLDPDFFVHTGDIVYYDKSGPFARSEELARFKWNRMYSLPFQRSFHNVTPAYFIKDDHDTLKNDCWPGQRYGRLTWEQGLEIFREQVPIGERPYRRFRWGRHLEIWLVEGRDFRSPNNMADGPDKSIWGEAQKQWFFATVPRSDATFRILISPTPIVGPDRSNKADNHTNQAFAHEGQQLRSFLAQQDNMYVICGDRHWQYVSVDPETGVREYSCGPTSDAHAGGFNQNQRTDAHQYLKVCGGFLSVRVNVDGPQPQLIFQHHAVDGSVHHEDVISVVRD